MMFEQLALLLKIERNLRLAFWAIVIVGLGQVTIGIALSVHLYQHAIAP
jgi:hypothetical protein